MTADWENNNFRATKKGGNICGTHSETRLEKLNSQSATPKGERTCTRRSILIMCFYILFQIIPNQLKCH